MRSARAGHDESATPERKIGTVSPYPSFFPRRRQFSMAPAPIASGLFSTLQLIETSSLRFSMEQLCNVGWRTDAVPEKRIAFHINGNPPAAA